MIGRDTVAVCCTLFLCTFLLIFFFVKGVSLIVTNLVTCTNGLIQTNANFLQRIVGLLEGERVYTQSGPPNIVARQRSRRRPYSSSSSSVRDRTRSRARGSVDHRG